MEQYTPIYKKTETAQKVAEEKQLRLCPATSFLIWPGQTAKMRQGELIQFFAMAQSLCFSSEPIQLRQIAEWLSSELASQVNSTQSPRSAKASVIGEEGPHSREKGRTLTLL